MEVEGVVAYPPGHRALLADRGGLVGLALNACMHTCTYRETDRQTDRETDRQTDRQTDITTCGLLALEDHTHMGP